MKMNGKSTRPHYKITNDQLKRYFIIARITGWVFGLGIILAIVQLMTAAGTMDYLDRMHVVDMARESQIDTMLISGFAAGVIAIVGYLFARHVRIDISNVLRKRIRTEKIWIAKQTAIHKKTVRPANYKTFAAAALYGMKPSYEKYRFLTE
jgi:ABC-type Fe3+ transport system permease subunit